MVTEQVAEKLAKRGLRYDAELQEVIPLKPQVQTSKDDIKS